MTFDTGDETGSAQTGHKLAHTAGIGVYAFRNTVTGQGTIGVQYDKYKDVKRITEFFWIFDK